MNEKRISRQRLYQIRKARQKRCTVCGGTVYRSGFCERHYWKNLLRKRAAARKRRGFKEWEPGGSGRPPLKAPRGMA